MISMPSLIIYICVMIRVEFRTGSDSVCPKLYSTLVGIQTGVIEDTKGWIVEID